MEDEIASAAVKFTCLCLIVWVLIVCLNMLNKQEKSTTIENIPLYSVVSSNEYEYEGHFFLGSGSIDGRQYYVAYKVLEDGGKKYFKMDKDKTVIYDTLENADTSYAEIEKNSFGITTKINLYVPKDTIVKTIDLSL